jgi:hypothetical protein
MAIDETTTETPCATYVFARKPGAKRSSVCALTADEQPDEQRHQPTSMKSVARALPGGTRAVRAVVDDAERRLEHAEQ